MAVRWLCNLFGKPFDGGKRNMEHGPPPPQQHQQSPPPQPGPFPYFQGGGGVFPGYPGGVSFFPGFPGGLSPAQHPSLVKLGELQGEVATFGPHVGPFSGLQSDREYKRLMRELTRLQLEIDQVETEGRPELQHARKRVAGEVEGLLRYLEGNATHPSRLAVEALAQEAQALLLTGIVEPHRTGLPAGGGEELLEAVQDVAMRLAQVKTGGSVPLRKARYRALTRVCAVLEVLDGMAPVRTLPLPLSNETHAAVQGINRAMGELSAARCQLVALLMGLSGRDSCANLARALTELQLELDALDVSGDAAIRNYRKQVVEEINGLLKHLDLEEEGDNTHRYDLTQNDSIREIEALRGRVCELRGEVLRQGVAGQGAELQCLLTRLDEVDTGRNPCIREARRRAVLEVQAVITYMDLQEALWRHQAEREQNRAQQRPPVEAVWRVLASLSELQARALGFGGKRSDKNYVVLEEMLTKRLLDLDAVDSQGDPDAKAARKQAVKYAQNILNYLDMKTDEWEY
ncbi:BAG family molecular chaperone regulator 5 isoform X2 [Clupea harengus]|uniref:BAG family molecular chaperone regulator 5 n=1 Tax=Clupea harengus TaxID=7950 RepID=A0A6P8GA78_CLUHA|nr:BAG family molecular chaperone regulator 5 isoform X2 [Clupea harengus]